MAVQKNSIIYYITLSYTKLLDTIKYFKELSLNKRKF